MINIDREFIIFFKSISQDLQVHKSEKVNSKCKMNLWRSKQTAFHNLTQTDIMHFYSWVFALCNAAFVYISLYILVHSHLLEKGKKFTSPPL